ncbi:hypothetical protein [Picosynechococcus sp. PCC 73109]|uniref:hypothetical protein n=1 Tax=Picosynechococcus sp. PCC 73109 TaxID=374982 RepID=UPI000745849C|nr:hypothetical protein [Picosynechococcus sp. PCC 73109]AMA08913.1 hypothetical protein AWQ23_06075 [Picosynechococcus sp. PCC 73109]
MKYLTVLFASLTIFGYSQSVLAQQKAFVLQEAWGFSRGFASFDWLRAEDKETIYSSAVYTEINRNTLAVYNTYKQDPFGKYARCGGLGCDLGKGQLIATLNFESRGNLLIVQSATGKAAFLNGALCKLVESYLTVLECTSKQNPNPDAKIPSIFRFAPGS